MTEPLWEKYPNFTRAEFVCRCGCGRADMTPGYMGLLQKIRDAYGKPMAISSGYRCPEHNARVSGTGRGGPHTTGRAADILVARGDALRLLIIAHDLGATGIGVQQKGSGRFLHIDNLPAVLDELAPPRPTIWSY